MPKKIRTLNELFINKNLLKNIQTLEQIIKTTIPPKFIFNITEFENFNPRTGIVKLLMCYDYDYDYKHFLEPNTYKSPKESAFDALFGNNEMAHERFSTRYILKNISSINSKSEAFNTLIKEKNLKTGVVRFLKKKEFDNLINHKIISRIIPSTPIVITGEVSKDNKGESEILAKVFANSWITLNEIFIGYKYPNIDINNVFNDHICIRF